jgi:hemerythrin superfamily protein
MMATDILKQQHREFEELARQIETAEDDDERAALRVELADMLAAHTAIEEELFYPATLEQLGPGSRIRESLEEHAVADFALYRLVSVSVADETFSAKLATLKDVVMNHIEEEESELFPQVDGEMDRQLLDQLGDKMMARFEERLREGHRPILERSLGIAARQVAVSAPGAKKAAPSRTRAPAKRAAKKAAAPQKRGMVAAKRGSAPKRASTPKRATPAKQVAPAKKASAHAQSTQQSSGRSTSGRSTSGRSTSRQTQTSTRGTQTQKSGRRAGSTRGHTTAKKSRAAG